MLMLLKNKNLVFVDEGHRGAGGDVVKRRRDQLSLRGFAFEYSATFVQAINAVKDKEKQSELTDEYAKNIVFDYSYKFLLSRWLRQRTIISSISKKTTRKIVRNTIFDSVFACFLSAITYLP